MVCVIFSGARLGAFVRLRGKVNADVYKQLAKHQVFSCAEKFNQTIIHVHTGQCPIVIT